MLWRILQVKVTAEAGVEFVGFLLVAGAAEGLQVADVVAAVAR